MQYDTLQSETEKNDYNWETMNPVFLQHRLLPNFADYYSYVTIIKSLLIIYKKIDKGKM
jgi:hypothetical protein